MSKGFFDEKIPVSKLVDIYVASSNSRYLQKFGKLFMGFKNNIIKFSLYYKDDVEISIDSEGNMLNVPKAGAISFFYGFNPNLDFISKNDIKYCEAI